MNNTKTALIIYPHQLFEARYLPAVDTVYVVEEPLLFGTDEEFPVAFHKQKLVLHRASMRRYVEEELWPNDINVEYVELRQISHTSDILQIAQKAGVSMVQVFDPADTRIEQRLHGALDTIIDSPFELKVLPSPSFLLRRGEIEDFFGDKKPQNFGQFYQWQRERFNILIDKKYKPEGGKWAYDNEPQKALPLGHVPPGFGSFGSNDYVEEAKKWVEKRFPNNPGSLDQFLWPTNHQEAYYWLQGFVKDRLADFGPYQQALDGKSMLLYHSGISGSLNSGLLTPDQVVNETLAAYSKSKIPITSLEPFIRQVIGWREYVRALYVIGGVTMRSANKLGQARALNGQWWEGSTGLPPVDDVILKANTHAYAQSAERFSVMSNVMLLCDISPNQTYKWFMSMFIDSYDWVVLPNVFGSTQLNDLGGMVNQSYIYGSSYILKMSHYEKDIWCDIWDGLFWGFVEKHQDILAKNSHTKMLPGGLKRLNPDHKRIIGYRAKDFLDSIA